MHDLAASYAEVLVHHVETGDGSDLARAYEIARTALAEGLGILDVAHLHVQALGQLGEPPRSRPGSAASSWRRWRRLS
jgi:hypothetical protein